MTQVSELLTKCPVCGHEGDFMVLEDSVTHHKSLRCTACKNEFEGQVEERYIRETKQVIKGECHITAPDMSAMFQQALEAKRARHNK